MDLAEKLAILTASARYDASCASSGTQAKALGKGRVGATSPAGVCHSWTGDGRCVSLLKVLYSNACRFDCAYCANRASAEVRRTSFTSDELASLTISFYRRNYIEGLFLSSGIFADPDVVMGKLVETARKLRVDSGFDGYIHLKAIPGAGERLLSEAARWADRLSANIELPTASSLRLLAPEKEGKGIIKAMAFLRDGILERGEDGAGRLEKSSFAPAGQSTQLVIGASPEPDATILGLADKLYKRMKLKRVYYSAYVPVSADARLPSATPPLRREHRLYQADWLLRFYGFTLEEICPSGRNLSFDYDPKAAWALSHPESFPIDISKADYETILRVPGIGVVGARRILDARRAGPLSAGTIHTLGIAMKRARHFIVIRGRALPESLSPGIALERALRDPRVLDPGGRDPGIRDQGFVAEPSVSYALSDEVLALVGQTEFDFGA